MTDLPSPDPCRLSPDVAAGMAQLGGVVLVAASRRSEVPLHEVAHELVAATGSRPDLRTRD